MKIAGIVILYHPDEKVSQNITTYSSSVDKLFLIDNTEKNNFSPEILDEKIEYIADRNNKGIAKRLNEVGKLAHLSGFNWLLTMDQDSAFTGNNLKRFLNCFKSYPGKENVSMFGINYSGKAGTIQDDCGPSESLDLITSGSLVNLKIWREMGGFDEQLFIDEVDFEYCLRSRQHGYKTIQFNSIYLNHCLGEVVVGRSLRNGKLTSRTIHSPIRMYYLTRNFLYIQKKYSSNFPEPISTRKKSLLIRIKNNLLYNHKRLLVIKYVIKGVFDFKRKKMGSIDQNHYRN